MNGHFQKVHCDCRDGEVARVFASQSVRSGRPGVHSLSRVIPKDFKK